MTRTKTNIGEVASFQFTKTLPTAPGDFAWRRAEYEDYELVKLRGREVKVAGGKTLKYLMGYRCGKDPIAAVVMGGEWCRLTPAVNLEHAWCEAREVDQDRDFTIDWDNSHTKELMEGTV